MNAGLNRTGITLLLSVGLRKESRSESLSLLCRGGKSVKKEVHFRVGLSNFQVLETSNTEITAWQCHQVQASFQSVALEEDGNDHGLHPRPSEHGESVLRCY